MTLIIKNQRKLLLTAFSMFLIQSCAITYTGSNNDFAIPGCENAWNEIAKARALEELKTLVTNDCSNLYQSKLRLSINNNKGGNNIPEVCNPAWKTLHNKKQLENVGFMITHNCPVFYRKGWTIPPR